MSNLDNVTMRDLLPPNFQYDPDAIAASEAISQDYQRIYALASQAVVFSNIDNLAENWLDLLAVDLNVDYYDTTLPVEAKRELVRKSIPMHRKKGTPWAVEELIRIVFGEGYVEEWWEYGGEPYHFRVLSSNPLATPEAARNFRAALESAQNLRSSLDDILILRTWDNVLNRDYITWQNVLGLHYWQDISTLTWQSVLGKTWGQLLGENTWGNVYSFIWEE